MPAVGGWAGRHRGRTLRSPGGTPSRSGRTPGCWPCVSPWRRSAALRSAAHPRVRAREGGKFPGPSPVGRPAGLVDRSGAGRRAAGLWRGADRELQRGEPLRPRQTPGGRRLVDPPRPAREVRAADPVAAATGLLRHRQGHHRHAADRPRSRQDRLRHLRDPAPEPRAAPVPATSRRHHHRGRWTVRLGGVARAEDPGGHRAGRPSHRAGGARPRRGRPGRRRGGEPDRVAALQRRPAATDQRPHLRPHHADRRQRRARDRRRAS